jgi:hypothetical protein
MVLLALVGLLLLADAASGTTLPDPSNRVVLLIDASGSYKARQAEAVERAGALLEAMAQTKLHRWEPAADRLILISLDAMPEVLWQGTLQELKQSDRTAWAARFRARKDYANCTDVSAGFRLAAQHLVGDSRYVGKYLFAFTDLIHEPPTTAIGTCRRPTQPSLPSDDFPWAGLADVSVAVFWVPPNQKLAWRRAVEERGLGATFALYTTSESAEVTISPPPRPTVELTEAERQVERERYLGYVGTLAKVIGLGAGGVVLVLIALGAGVALIRLCHRRRQPTQAAVVRPVPPRPVAIRRPGAPLPLGGAHPPTPRPPAPPRHGHRM